MICCMSCYKCYVTPKINLYLTNAPNPFKSASNKHTKFIGLRPFKHSLQSCRGLELHPHSLSPHYVTVCGQIHPPATLLNYVHMHLMNSKFLASLYSSKPRMFVFMLSNWCLSFPSKQTCYAVPVHWVLWHTFTFQCEASFTLPSTAVTASIFVTECFV